MGDWTYYSTWRTEEFLCHKCQWRGNGSDLYRGEIFSGKLMGGAQELDCPKCYNSLGVLLFPTIEEKRAHWEELTDKERRDLEFVETRLATFEKQKLTSSNSPSLPNINDGSFVLTWDIEFPDPEAMTVIKYGDTEIHRELAFWEGYWRFVEVAEILKSRYGRALLDLIPSELSEPFLGGDFCGAWEAIKRARLALARE